MKLFVSGGAGFIGSNFILYWLREHPDDEIINFDVLTYAGNLASLKGLEKNPQYTFIKGDIRNRQAVAEAMAGCQTVIHFAAETHVDRSILEPSAFVSTNVLGTHILLEVARELAVERFHHISTDEVFGSLELDSSEKFHEDTPYQPSSPYSAAKAGSDFLVRAYHHTFGLPITITNCSNNYGPYQFPEKLIPLMVLNALEGKPLPVYGDGKNVRDWIYVEDHARAIDLVLQKGRVGETYCVGGESERSNLEVVKSILRILNKPESLIEFVKDRPGHDRRYAISNEKIKKELGFQPERSFEDRLQQTVEWYVENEEWWRGVLNKDYLQYYERQYGER